MEPYMHMHVEEFYDTLRDRSGPERARSWLSASAPAQLTVGEG
jgi:hypothetical protein